METTKLTLYYLSSCPYCQKVLRALEELKVKIPIKNIHENDEYRQELIKIGGKSQVPCLVINGKAMYESDNIVKWLKENYKK